MDDFELTSTIHNLRMNVKEYYIAISNTREQLVVFCFGKKIIRKIINFDSIISVEVFENGKTTYTKSTSRTIGGAIIGGILAGGAGAIIGGTTGKTTKEQKINSLKIKILLRDVDNPTYTIDWYEGEGLDITFGTSQKIYERCMKIKDAITVIIDKVDSKENTRSDSNIDATISIADEILKLSKLKDMGILTDEEFDNKKKSLLS